MFGNLFKQKTDVTKEQAPERPYTVNVDWEAYLCEGHTPYSCLDDIFDLNSEGYRPSVYIYETRNEQFADAYDRRAEQRGDERRAFRCDMRKR